MSKLELANIALGGFCGLLGYVIGIYVGGGFK